MGLGGVLVQVDAALFSELPEAFDVERVAVQVHGHDALGLVRDQRGNVVHVQGVVVQFDVGKHRGGPGQRDGVAGGGKGERRNNNLVARPDTGSQEPEVQSRGAGVHGNG